MKKMILVLLSLLMIFSVMNAQERLINGFDADSDVDNLGHFSRIQSSFEPVLADLQPHAVLVNLAEAARFLKEERWVVPLTKQEEKKGKFYNRRKV